LDAAPEEEAVEVEAAVTREDFTRRLLRFLPEFRRTKVPNLELLAAEGVFVKGKGYQLQVKLHG
jgi:hypothetical protein